MRDLPWKFLIAASVVLSLTFCSLQSKHQSVPVLSIKEQQHIIKETQCLKTAVWFEARNQGVEGMVAVISVIKNRKNSGVYPATYCGVIDQKWQFSFKNKQNRLVVKEVEVHVLKIIENLSFTAVNNSLNPNLPSDVLFYHSNKIKPKWSMSMLKYTTIRDHNFYIKDFKK